MRDYYVQRASAGLIFSEATSVTPLGVGYPHTPGVWSNEQVEGWRVITKGVHEAGGRISLQLWHVGRISDPSYHNGALPVAPSAIAPKGHVSLLRPERPYTVPRALETDELPGVVAAFRKGAQNAQAAGFDGVEIHGANGYLLDQFLQDGSNKRTDGYGGSIENRARLMLEVTDAVVSVWGAGRVGVHLAPRGDAHDMGDSDLAARPSAMSPASLASGRSRSFAHANRRRRRGWGRASSRPSAASMSPTKVSTAKRQKPPSPPAKRTPSPSANSSSPIRTCRNASGSGAPLNPWNAHTFYGDGPVGYTDYLSLEDGAQAAE